MAIKKITEPQEKVGVFSKQFKIPRPALWVMWSLFLAVLVFFTIAVITDESLGESAWTILFLAFLVVFTYPGKKLQDKILALGKKLEFYFTILVTWVIYAALVVGAIFLLFWGVSWLFSGSSAPSVEDRTEDAAQDAIDDYKSNCYEKGSVLICPND
ncbi:MAG TPA: hypothetical protein VLH94_04185 [Spirochaetia bacterium]|nr:hypothetical protein [Spirochaetia bacterium]